MKRIATVAAGVVVLLTGLFGLWLTVAFLEFFADHILVLAAVSFSVVVAGGTGLIIRAFSAA
ncbi:hypothetical protein B2J88_43240 [Rhodococcus sp. SRB_17]|nr:hypothetical protein [Rhodococcus sp. SRB_17]